MAIYALGDKKPLFNRDEVFIADSADLMGDVVLHKGANIWFGAVLRADDNTITIGPESNVQDNAVLHVDPENPCTIGRNVTIGHMAMVHGCTVGENTLIGIGATILDGAIIGKNTLIGAHTLIGLKKEIPEGVMVMGTPGKVVRELTDEELEFLKRSGQEYAAKGRWFMKDLVSTDL